VHRRSVLGKTTSLILVFVLFKFTFEGASVNLFISTLKIRIPLVIIIVSHDFKSKSAFNKFSEYNQITDYFNKLNG